MERASAFGAGCIAVLAVGAVCRLIAVSTLEKPLERADVAQALRIFKATLGDTSDSPQRGKDLKVDMIDSVAALPMQAAAVAEKNLTQIELRSKQLSERKRARTELLRKPWTEVGAASRQGVGADSANKSSVDEISAALDSYRQAESKVMETLSGERTIVSVFHLLVVALTLLAAACTQVMQPSEKPQTGPWTSTIRFIGGLVPALHENDRLTA